MFATRIFRRFFSTPIVLFEILEEGILPCQKRLPAPCHACRVQEPVLGGYGYKTIRRLWAICDEKGRDRRLIKAWLTTECLQRSETLASANTLECVTIGMLSGVDPANGPQEPVFIA